MSEELAGTEGAAQEQDVSLDTQQSEETVSDVAEEPKEKTGNPKIDDPWPSSARNKVNRLNKQLAKERAEREQFARKLQEFQAAQEKNSPKSKEPQEEDFDNYGEYLQALARYRPEVKQDQQIDPRQLQQQAFQQAQQELYYNQRVDAVAQQAQKAVQEMPELQNLLEEYSDVLDTYPPEIEMAFLQSENAPMAFYALAKEGKLEQLAFMTPMQAAHEIARAGIRGEQMAKAAKVTKAPTPIKGASGSSPGGKDLSAKSPRELVDWALKT